MPPRLPDRYRLNIRLGSDGDIEEWLAQDESLDRPVLVRYLAAEASLDRRAAFLDGVRAAAGLTELHLQKVFAAGETAASAYSVSEWDGGVSFADRMRAGEGLPVEEFLPNAAGLCLALSRFHETGAVHGAIDTSAVHFSAAHPAKIAAFGRQQRWIDAASDTKALAEVLRAGLTGSEDTDIMPSSVLEGVHPVVDEALTAGIEGRLDAAAMAAALGAVTYEPLGSGEPTKPWRALVIFGLIAAAISLIAAVGLAADFDPDSPFLYPVGASPDSPTPTTPIDIDTPDDSGVLNVRKVVVYDPLGDETERDDEVSNVIDGDPSTSWRTEAYSMPIREFKDGVGLVFDVDGTPSTMFIRGLADTTYLIGWSTSIPDSPDGWEHILRGTLQTSEVRAHLPVRGAGVWRLWFIDLPEQRDETFQTIINEVRFTS
jgi:serine/threonine protein kinase